MSGSRSLRLQLSPSPAFATALVALHACAALILLVLPCVSGAAGRRYINRFMLALPVQGPVRRTVLVADDMLGEDSFRVLRIWALWGKLPQVAAQQLPA